MTGISPDLAKFQARSAFTGVGFTTQEAEKVVSHPVRRRILMILMLLGNAGVITAISSLVLTFVGPTEPFGRLQRVGFIVLGLGFIWVLASSRWVNRYLSRIIDWALEHWTSLDLQDYSSLLHLSSDYQVSELRVKPDGWLADQQLSDLGLLDEGVVVLGIQRRDDTYIGVPMGKTVICAGDVLILYGRAAILHDLKSRRADWVGEAAHRQAMEEQQRIVSEQNRQDLQTSRQA